MVKVNNVRELPGVGLPVLSLASTASLGGLIRGSRNELWRCQAFSSSGEGLILYIKPALNRRAMFIEALSAQLGQCLNLPCPNPYLVTVNPTHVGKPKGQKFLAFGSEAANERGLAYPVRNLEVLIELLDKTKLTEAVCVFDEWIANSVRSSGDVLFDPDGRRAYIIDHEGAMESHTQPQSQVPNWLAMRITERVKPIDRPTLLHALRSKAVGAHRAKLDPIPSTVQAAQDGMIIYKELLMFLESRLQHLDRLLSQRVMPDQIYLIAQQPANDNEANGTT